MLSDKSKIISHHEHRNSGYLGATGPQISIPEPICEYLIIKSCIIMKINYLILL